MSLHRANGSRATRASIDDYTDAVTDPDPYVKITETLTVRSEYSGGSDKAADTEDDKVQQAFLEGEVVRRSEVLALMTPATVKNIAPASGAAAGGTVVNVYGTDLDGVTAVTVGGAAATNVTPVSSRQVRFTTPAGTAGARAVVLTDDGGAVTHNSFTYTP